MFVRATDKSKVEKSFYMVGNCSIQIAELKQNPIKKFFGAHKVMRKAVNFTQKEIIDSFPKGMGTMILLFHTQEAAQQYADHEKISLRYKDDSRLIMQQGAVFKVSYAGDASKLVFSEQTFSPSLSLQVCPVGLGKLYPLSAHLKADTLEVNIENRPTLVSLSSLMK